MIVPILTLILTAAGAPWGMWCKQSGKSLHFMLSTYMLAWIAVIVIAAVRVFLF